MINPSKHPAWEMGEGREPGSGYSGLFHEGDVFFYAHFKVLGKLQFKYFGGTADVNCNDIH